MSMKEWLFNYLGKKAILRYWSSGKEIMIGFNNL